MVTIDGIDNPIVTSPDAGVTSEGSSITISVLNNDTDPDLTNNGATVWWFFTAPGDGTVTVDTFGSDFDTILTIYEGFFPGAGPGDRA